MDYIIKKRIIDEAHYMINTKKTVREIAKIFNISKSTIHNDLHEKLKYINLELYNEIKSILNYHKKIRHIRGGQSTKKKYEKLKFVD